MKEQLIKAIENHKLDHALLKEVKKVVENIKNNNEDKQKDQEKSQPFFISIFNVSVSDLVCSFVKVFIISTISSSSLDNPYNCILLSTRPNK